MLMLLMRHAPELLCLRLHPLRLSSDDPRAMAISNRALAIIAFWLTQVFGGPLLSLTLRARVKIAPHRGPCFQDEVAVRSSAAAYAPREKPGRRGTDCNLQVYPSRQV
jgi:hypothetical protein